MRKKYVKLLWKWIDRKVPESFFTKKLTAKQAQARWDEIPSEVKPLAHAMIELARKNAEAGRNGTDPYSCLLYRCMLFALSENLKKKGLDLGLPYAWFCDGPMVEPVWIVKITNGIVKWTCDAGKEICGMEKECRFYKAGKIKGA